MSHCVNCGTPCRQKRCVPCKHKADHRVVRRRQKTDPRRQELKRTAWEKRYNMSYGWMRPFIVVEAY